MKRRANGQDSPWLLMNQCPSSRTSALCNDVIMIALKRKPSVVSFLRAERG